MHRADRARHDHGPHLAGGHVGVEDPPLRSPRVDIGVRPDGFSVNGLPPGARLVGADGRDQSTVIS
jgi:hypothetical protein